MKQEVITLNQDQLKRLDVINQANSGFITVKEAAESLGLSTRQIKRLKKEVATHGAAALIHKNSLRTPSNALTQAEKLRILSIRSDPIFKDCNFAHFCEILAVEYGIQIAYSTLHRLLSQEGIISPKKRRRYKPHKRRPRKPQAGLLLQVDATPYAWFHGNRKRYCLHGAIDDATGQVTGLYLCKNECLFGYHNMLRRTIQNFGIPLSLYTDQHTIFRSPNMNKAHCDPTVEVHDTQFGMALKDLAIEIIYARSAQAKGRVERLWGTLQSRLPVELAMRGIETIEGANDFLSSYIYAFNSEFAVEPEDAHSLFRPLGESIDLDHVLCIREKRIMDNGGVFSYKNKLFKVEDGAYAGQLPNKARITVLLNPNFGDTGIKVSYRGLLFNVTPYTPPRRTKEAKAKHRNTIIPAKNHPYRYGQSIYPKLDYSLTDREVMEMLEDAFLR